MDFLIILLLVAVLVWVYFVDKKTERPQVLNIDVNISMSDDGVSSDSSTTYNQKTENRKPKTTKEIPIETGTTGSDWKNLKITDSFNG